MKFILKGDVEVLKKALISGTLFVSILLGGCNEEPVVLDNSKNEENDTELLSESESESESNLLSEVHNEIIASIEEQTEIDSESIAIMLGGSPVKGIIDVSLGFPKDVKVDETMIQQIVQDSIKKASETENITISEENITTTIEKY
jgi:septum formation topological specificity factor MinE